MRVSGTQPLYSIGAVAEMLGTSPATLRSWEERYGVVQPERTEGGRRLYSRDDVEHLRGVPVLAISSLDARERALDAGADAFLQKPLDPLQLVSAVKDLLGQSALVRGSAR